MKPPWKGVVGGVVVIATAELLLVRTLAPGAFIDKLTLPPLAFRAAFSEGVLIGMSAVLVTVLLPFVRGTTSGDVVVLDIEVGL